MSIINEARGIKRAADIAPNLAQAEENSQ